MKAFTLLLMLLVSAPLVAIQEKQESGNQEIIGTIKEVSINVRRLTVEIETTPRQERIVSVEPETQILVNRREGNREDLKPGQSSRVVLQHASSRAVVIEVI